jgi:DNA-binding protein YbaB
LADHSKPAAPQRRIEQEQLDVNAALSRQSATATAGAGLVRVRVDGNRVVRELSIDPELFAGRDADLVADLIMSAIAEAQRRISELAPATTRTAAEPGGPGR